MIYQDFRKTSTKFYQQNLKNFLEAFTIKFFQNIY